MCGIAGIIDKNNKFTLDKKEKVAFEMLRLINHRGGDAIGVETIDNVTFAHTRLSIVDATSSANQPVLDGDMMLSFNGEIYNHMKLRNKYLKSKKIISHSDTVTLFELLKLLPIKKVISLIEGMYAFSFLNSKEKSLNLILDKFAIKPLYYIDTPNFFAWASEIKAFKAVPEFKFEFQDKNLEEYLVFRYIAGDETLFKGVYKIMAGENLTFSLKGNSFIKETYYKINKTLKITNIPLEKMLKNSICDHLMGDKPVGIQLSGGVDSSLIAYFAQNLSKRKFHTFSIGLKDKLWNEFIYSDRVAKLVRSCHHRITFSKKDFIKLFPKITYHLDEPIVHPNTIPMYLLAKKARKYTKVLLTGEGADEFFYGYNRYFQKTINSQEILSSNSFNDKEIISKILKNAQNTFPERKRILDGVNKSNKIKKISYYDIYTYLPHVLLRQDKAGMAANIENRVPFIYNPIYQYAYNSNKNIGKYGGKNPVKKIALKYLPTDLVLRRKCGFGLPITDWLKDKSVFLPHLSDLKRHKIIKKYFVKSEVSNFITEHISGSSDHSNILFTLVSLMTWYNVFIDNK